MRWGLGRPELRAWALYDWANSAFVTVVITAVFPVYFAHVAAAGGLSAAQATWRFTLATAVALAVAALMSPPLGLLADRRTWKKPLLALFLALGVSATAAMSRIGDGEWRFALLLFMLANIGAAGSFVLYDALLPRIAAPDEMDRVSAAGYALGYLGGGALLAVNLVWIQRPEWFGLSGADAAVHLSFASVALWWGVFSLPLFRWVAEPPAIDGLRRPLGAVFLDLARRPDALRFLVAFLVYNDGINTIIRLATTYGSELGISAGALISAVLLVQVLGVPATFAFGQLAHAIGAKPAILLALTAYAGVALLGYFMTTAAHFYLLAGLISLVQGGCQALSRSLFASLIPRARSAEFFGLFAVFEKFSAILGPLVFAAAIALTGSSRLAILSISSFFLVGAALLAIVDVERGRRAREDA